MTPKKMQRKTLAVKILDASSKGMSPTQIATLLNTSKAFVYVTRSRAKQSKIVSTHGWYKQHPDHVVDVVPKASFWSRLKAAYLVLIGA